MSYQMKLDEMQEALSNAGHPQAEAFEKALCSIGDAMAAALAATFDIETGETTQEGVGFAGICCPFSPRYQRQPLPGPMDYFDDADSWGEMTDDAELEPPARYVVEPQKDRLKGEPEGADGSTHFVKCDAFEAEHWAVIDTQRDDLCGDYPDAFRAYTVANGLNASNAAAAAA